MKILKKLTIPYIKFKYRNNKYYSNLVKNIEVFDLNEVNDIQVQIINNKYYLYFFTKETIYKWGPFISQYHIYPLLNDILRFYNFNLGINNE